MLQAISSQLVRDLATNAGVPMDHLQDLSTHNGLGAYVYWIGFGNGRSRGVKVLFIGTLVSIWEVERQLDGSIGGLKDSFEHGPFRQPMLNRVNLHDPNSIDFLNEFMEKAVLDD